MDAKHQYVICVSDRGDELSVVKGKVYRVVDPEPQDNAKDIRVIDETGEDYLYDRTWFEQVTLTDRTITALEAAAS